MRRAEGVVFALGALGEARQAAALTQRTDAIAPPGQDLVRVALVAHVPDQAVFGRVEDVVDRHGQLDHTEAGAQMPTGGADRIDHFGAQFVGQLAQLATLKFPEVGGKIDLVEQGRFGTFRHDGHV